MAGRRSFSDDEIKRILAALRKTANGRERLYWKRDQAWVLMMLKHGFRVSEVLSLRVRDVMEAGTLLDWVSVERRNTKGKRQGVVKEMNLNAKRYLRRWLEQLAEWKGLKPNDFIFRSQIDKQWANTQAITREQAWAILKDACRRAGVLGRTGTHSLRKSFGQNVYKMSGNDINLASQELRHTDVKVSQLYLAGSNEEFRKKLRRH